MLQNPVCVTNTTSLPMYFPFPTPSLSTTFLSLCEPSPREANADKHTLSTHLLAELTLYGFTRFTDITVCEPKWD